MRPPSTAFAVALTCAACSSTPRPPHDRATAYVMCQQWLEERLKSPASADYPFGGSAEMKDLGEGKYSIASYVDAQNSFGAMMRINYSCTTQWVEGTTWRLESMTVNQR